MYCELISVETAGLSFTGRFVYAYIKSFISVSFASRHHKYVCMYTFSLKLF